MRLVKRKSDTSEKQMTLRLKNLLFTLLVPGTAAVYV
jgi:hypothetical protein